MRKAIIIGADPAGLRTAYELLKQTDITPVVLERSREIGNLSNKINWFRKVTLKIYRTILSGSAKEQPNPSLQQLVQQIQDMGGRIFLYQQIYQIYSVGSEVCSIHVINRETGELSLFSGDYFLSSAPYQEIIQPMPHGTNKFTNLFLITSAN